jgi:membrane-associated phospholipid phosphatase
VSVPSFLRRHAVLRELLLVAGGMVTYAGVRAVTEGNVATAFANARRIVELEQSLGIAWEHRTQTIVLTYPWVATFANWVYIWGHWPVIVVAAVWLYRRHRRDYRRLRNAMFLSGSIGFLFFALFPVAPPRLLGGYVDTILERSNSYRALQPPSVTNQYAAMPSLHFGWNMLVGVVIAMTATVVVVRVVAIAFPAAMGFAIVATANHYVLDLAAGFALAMLALAVVVAVERISTLDGHVAPPRSRPPLRKRPDRAPVGDR